MSAQQPQPQWLIYTWYGIVAFAAGAFLNFLGTALAFASPAAGLVFGILGQLAFLGAGGLWIMAYKEYTAPGYGAGYPPPPPPPSRRE